MELSSDKAASPPPGKPPLSRMSKNWHWKQRELGGWAKTWMETQLTGLSTGLTTIDNVKEIVEDCCTLGMRKSKVYPLLFTYLSTI